MITRGDDKIHHYIAFKHDDDFDCRLLGGEGRNPTHAYHYNPFAREVFEQLKKQDLVTGKKNADYGWAQGSLSFGLTLYGICELSPSKEGWVVNYLNEQQSEENLRPTEEKDLIEVAVEFCTNLLSNSTTQKR